MQWLELVFCLILKPWRTVRYCSSSLRTNDSHSRPKCRVVAAKPLPSWDHISKLYSIPPLLMGGAPCVAFQMTLDQKEADMKQVCLVCIWAIDEILTHEGALKSQWCEPLMWTFSATNNIATLKTCLEKDYASFSLRPRPWGVYFLQYRILHYPGF